MSFPPHSALHVSRCVGPRGYGVGAIAYELARAQQDLGWKTTNWSTDSQEELEELDAERAFRRELRRFSVFGPSRFALSPSMLRAAAGNLGEQFDILHLHSLWSACGCVVNRWRNHWKRPVVIAPHGTLDPWVLRVSKFKKRVAQVLYDGPNLRAASCLHATSEQEIDAFREFGLSSPIALIPNGVSSEWFSSVGNAVCFREKFGLGDNRIMLYLSRVTPKKGLVLLLRSLAQCPNDWDTWQLVIAGPDEHNYTEELRSVVKSLGLVNKVSFIGPIFGQDRRNAFEAAELVTLPTYSEGNPMVVYESLAVGVPVLTTTGAPCHFLVQESCGWRTPVTVKGLVDGIHEACNLSSKQLTEWGKRGRRICQSQFTWTEAANRSLQLYQWLIGQGERPSFVVVKNPQALVRLGEVA